MDGLPNSKPASAPLPRRTIPKCPPDRFGVSRCRRSASRKSTGKRRAKKQLRQCPKLSTNNSDSDPPAEYSILHPSSHRLQEDNRINNERLRFTKLERTANDYCSLSLPLRNRVPSSYINNPSIPSLCINCGDYVAHRSPQSSFRSLPNYLTSGIDPIDLSPDGSSGPISFDSGIEQHNSLPYTRSLNSSPYTTSTFPLTKHYSSKPNTKDISISYQKHWNKSNANKNVDLSTKGDALNEQRIYSLNNKTDASSRSTKSVQTQTEWAPLKFVNRTQLLSSKFFLDGWRTVDTVKRKVKLLQICKNSGQSLKEKTKWIKRSSASSVPFEEDPERGYYSDSAVNATIEIIMPVGTSFANSAMKSSFSLSSLQGASGGTPGTNGSPMRVPAPPERPYHSLTKKRKDPNRELWRRSWGSTQSNQSAQSLGSSATLAAKDEFWAALQYNYNYIMDNQLIDSCKEANGELSAYMASNVPTVTISALPSTTNQWSIRQLIAEFTEICQWLTSVQEEVYASPENLANKSLRAARMKELVKCENKRRRFLEQSAAILSRGESEASAEVTWRARHLVLKWDSVLQSMSPEDGFHTDNSLSYSDAEHEVKCLRRWLHEMEGRLQPLSTIAARSWTRLQLDQKTQEHQVLQREVQWQGRIVSSVVRLCRLGPAEGAARALERRWHLLYLRALEWQCQLEACLARIDSQESSERTHASDSDEGPVVKHRRLVGPSSDFPPIIVPAHGFQHYPIRSTYSDDDSFSEGDVDDDDRCDGLVPNYSFKGTSAGSEADTEGSIIEEDNDIIMESLHNSKEIVKSHFNMSLDDNCLDNKIAEKNDDQVVVESCVIIDTVDGIDPNSTLNSSLYDEHPQTPPTVVKRPKKPVDISKFNRSNRKSKNCATFYFKHQDTDSDRQILSGTSGTDERSQEETSEEEWTYTVCEKNNSNNSDTMTSSFEQQSELTEDSSNRKNNVCTKLDFRDSNDTMTEEKSDIPEKTIENGLAKVELNTNSIDKNIEHVETKVNKPDLVINPSVISKESIKRLLNQAEEMVQKQAQNALPKELKSKKTKIPRNFKPLIFGDEMNGVQSQSKMSRIKEWIKHARNKHDDSSQQILDSCDASGEYTTGDSDPDRLSVTSDDQSPSVDTYRNVASSQEHSINIETPPNQNTPEHHTKVILRGKKNSCQNPRPWSVSCLSQLNYTKETPKASGSGNTLNTPIVDGEDVAVAYGRTSGMSISESALNTLAINSHGMRGSSSKEENSKFQGSMSSVKTTVQGNISSSTTINEGYMNCNEYQDSLKQNIPKRRLSKLKTRQPWSTTRESEKFRHRRIIAAKKEFGLVKSSSFSGMSDLYQKELKQERCTASDPSASSRNKHGFDTTSSSGNDSEDDLTRQPLRLGLGRSTDRTLNASSEDQDDTDCFKQKVESIPKFKLGPEGGLVRPRLPINLEIDQTALTELSMERDSDVDKSVQTAGTEEHSSFSEQAWDSYQEKYNSENYSEAPDSDAARQLLDCDDYRAYLDSQSDCCSSLSAHPDHEPSPSMNRKKFRFPNYSPTESNSMADKYYKNSVNRSPHESTNYPSIGRRSKKSSTSSIERKKSLMDSLERSKRSSDSLEKLRRSKKVLNDNAERRNSKRSSISDCDFNQLQSYRRYTSSNSTNSDTNNSSLEYQCVKPITNGSNKPDIIDSLSKRSRKQSNESNKLPLSVELSMHDSSKNLNSTSMDSPMRRKRYSNSHVDDSSDGINDTEEKTHSMTRRKSSGITLHPLNGSNSENRNLDYDSDNDDIKLLIDRSRSQLEATESVLSKEDVTPDLLQPNDYIEIVTTCQENIRCLEAVLGEASVLSATRIREIRGIISKWNSSLSVGERRATARALRREFLTLLGIAVPLPPSAPLHTRSQLLQRLEQLKKHQNLLHDQKPALLKLNVAVHRLLTDAKNSSSGSTLTDTLCRNLKDEVSELYRKYEEANESTSNEIHQLENVNCTWGTWEHGLNELHGALRGDSATLKLIEAALAGGDPARVAPHVSQVARLLSETSQQKGECGSWSDSGISDSGSEQELSERERRLTGLRVLARAMEAALTPGSQLLKAITNKMNEAEKELRELQIHCRNLIVKTAGGVVISTDKNSGKISNISPKEALLALDDINLRNRSSPDDPDSEPSGSEGGSGRAKRWAWCSLPIQICLLALLCACLLGGPRCCDAVNNLGAGLTPHLRYVKGPPPV